MVMIAFGGLEGLRAGRGFSGGSESGVSVAGSETFRSTFGAGGEATWRLVGELVRSCGAGPPCGSAGGMGIGVGDALTLVLAVGVSLDLPIALIWMEGPGLRVGLRQVGGLVVARSCKTSALRDFISYVAASFSALSFSHSAWRILFSQMALFSRLVSPR